MTWLATSACFAGVGAVGSKAVAPAVVHWSGITGGGTRCGGLCRVRGWSVLGSSCVSCLGGCGVEKALFVFFVEVEEKVLPGVVGVRFLAPFLKSFGEHACLGEICAG